MARPRFELKRVSGAPVSDQELLADLHRVAIELGLQTAPQRRYALAGLYEYSTVIRRFGSWNRALVAAGLQISNEVQVSDERLFENLLTLWQSLGRQPRRSDLTNPLSKFSQSPYLRRFSSWTAALQEFVNFANAADDSPAPTQDVATRRTSRDPSLRLRFRVLSCDRFSCVQCGASPANAVGVLLHVDHIVPWSKGGGTTLENLQTLCSACNLGKGDIHSGA